MKLIVLLVFIIMSNNVFASGKLSVQPNHYLGTEKLGFVYGLSVYEKIAGPVFYNGWTGYGDVDQAGKTNWFTSKHAVDINIWRVTISPGFQFNYDQEGKDWEQVVNAKVSYQIW